MFLTETEKKAALKAAVKEKIASMTDAEVSAFVANAEAEKVAAAAAADAQAGGRIVYHGYKEAMQRFEELETECKGDKIAALNRLIPEVAAIDVTSEAVKSASESADAFSSADAEAQMKIASDESLPEHVRKLAHDTLVRHGYELVDAAS